MPRYINPQPQYFSTTGIPLNGGLLYFYEPSTLISKNTFSDTALSIPNTNPIVLSTGGSPVTDIWLNGVYRVRLTDSLGNLLWDKDPVGGDSGDRIPLDLWLSGISYNIGDLVTGSNDRYYVSIVEPNLNNNPVSSPVSWTEFRLLRVYNANETYQIGTIVQDSAGFLWRAKAITAGSAPVLGSAFWEPAIDGYAQIANLVNTTTLSAPATLVKNTLYRLNNAGPFELPLISTTSSGDKIVILHNPDINPSITAQGADVIRVAPYSTFAADYDDVLLNIGASIVLTSNGTKWELN